MEPVDLARRLLRSGILPEPPEKLLDLAPETLGQQGPVLAAGQFRPCQSEQLGRRGVGHGDGAVSGQGKERVRARVQERTEHLCCRAIFVA